MIVREVAAVSSREWLRRELAAAVRLQSDLKLAPSLSLTEAFDERRDMALVVIDVAELFKPLPSRLPPLAPSPVPMMVIGRAEDTDELMLAWSSGICAQVLEQIRLHVVLEMMDKSPLFASLHLRQGAMTAQQVYRFIRQRLTRQDLTASEAMVMDLVQRGYGNQAIARRLGRAEQTIKNLVSSAYSKLGLSGRHEAIAMGLDDWDRGDSGTSRHRKRLQTAG